MEEKSFPQNWQIGQDYDPNTHLMKIERYDKRSQRKTVAEYLNVQNRLLWFIRDQRALIVAGLAKHPYVIQTDLVEMDRERNWAHYKTFIRDVLGNEATMYGSESANDFPDFAEKASTKSLGRALLLLGYGTAFAPEMDEGDERIVDTPVEKVVTAPVATTPTPISAARPAAPAQQARPQSPTRGTNTTSPDAKATDRQMNSIRKLYAALGMGEAPTTMTFAQAREVLTQLSEKYSSSRSHAAS